MPTHEIKTPYLAALLITVTATATTAAPPHPIDDRYVLELVAEAPAVVTPVGLAFDPHGALLVVESHTHQRRDDYPGPAADRIRRFSDSDGDGRLDRWTTFAEGFRHALNVLARPDGGVYVVTRDAVHLLRDADGDGQSDTNEAVLRLETETDYPHNGLGGVALSPVDGTLLVGLGENFGAPYRLVGADGQALTGQGGAGAVFRCSPDSRNLERLATGFWNPFGIAALPDGRVFAIDNDPDASPPCRLLHVTPGGDYGFIWQYGRAGVHPLQAWNGELPGTLPMACGVGEAPTALVAHGGRLWVTSWGDHRIERYRLVPRGASYAAEREVIVQGGVDFRPTGMAVAPDGSLYFGDWIKRDYEVHGQGRLWRLTLPAEELTPDFPPRSDEDRQTASYHTNGSAAAARSDDPFVRTAAAFGFSQRDDLAQLAADLPELAGEPRLRLTLLQARRWRGTDAAEPLLRDALRDDSADVRLFAVRWIADERLTALRDDVAKLLDGPPAGARYYLALLGAIDWLDHEPTARGSRINDELLVSELRKAERPAAVQALALGLLSPDDPFLTLPRLRDYLHADAAPLRLEAVRSLALRTTADRFDLLVETARDETQGDAVRAEAITGLAAAVEQHEDLLAQFAAGDNHALRREAERVLRLSQRLPAPEEQRPPATDLAAWEKLLDQPGDADSGRRLFFSSVGARCCLCHQHSGRGGSVGPDLTHIAGSSTRARIIASILQPSQEIAPSYRPWLLVTDDGKAHTGLRLPEPGDDGVEDYVNSTGERFSLPSESIELREVSTASIMPDGLETTVSIADLRDLLTFLTTPSQQ